MALLPSSDLLQRQSLIPALNLLRSGAPGSSTIEESITDLVKPLDNLCANYGFTTQDLLVRLDQDNRGKVQDVISDTRKKFLQIARTTYKPEGKVKDCSWMRLQATVGAARRACPFMAARAKSKR